MSGALTIPGARAFLACRASAPLCPECWNPVRRVHLQQGSAFAICEGRPPLRQRRAPEDSHRCGARLHLLGTGLGIVLVAALSREEYAELTVGLPRSALEIYEALQLIAARAH